MTSSERASLPGKIEKITARAVNAPIEAPVKTASGEITQAPLVIIDLITSDGIRGTSYLFAYTPLTLKALVSFIDDLAPNLIGKNAAPVSIYAECERMFRLLGRQGIVGMALSGIDMALWDVLAKAAGMPLAELLGGDTKPIEAYDSYGVVDPERDAARLETTLERGFRAIKIKLGLGAIADDTRTLKELRNIIGPNMRVMVDYNQSLDVPEALERIEAISQFDITWVEEPVPAEDLAGHALVREKSPVPIQTGENWWFPEGAANSISARASDFVMPDLMKIGGVTGFMRAAAMAQGASLPVSSHLFIEASAHVLAATANAHYLEYLDFAGSILKERLLPVNGCIVPRGPGLGLEWDEDALKRCAI
ncbi:mandelate racemase [Stappia sp. GBMRC 2046]|uniref:Mandelate racemase n=1 Tax=Stappia sediminis TaxID=2692190 RepID=A0A7X3LRH8_9HYPH|nr:enolase C-terminal domain-like protein [Stappia sediminis]MXN63762.1 mandelate racemase [Stappia sediminis]